MPETGIISKSDSEVDVVVEWKINSFATLLVAMVRNGIGYYSPEFAFDGERWRLWIFSNGSSLRDCSGHVDLGLSKHSFNYSIRQSFSLSLKTANGKKYDKGHCMEDFGDNDNRINKFTRIITRSELTRRKSELMPEGVLMVLCTMMSSTSAGSASNTASPSAECHFCKGTFNADSLSSHRNKCMHRPTKCPDCLEVVTLQKWLNEHECQQERPEGEACASGSSISSHEKKLHDDLKDLFLKKEDCDVIIKVKGSEIPAHRIILKARSPVFASTFQHNMKENATGIVEIEDSDPSPFMDFLRFLYYGDIGMISQKNVFDIFTLADKYEVLDLKAKCLEFMKRNMTVDTFCETITLALQYSETELIALATHFFVRNAEEILHTIKWQTFAVENPTQSNELVIKLVKWFKYSNV